MGQFIRLLVIATFIVGLSSCMKGKRLDEDAVDSQSKALSQENPASVKFSDDNSTLCSGSDPVHHQKLFIGEWEYRQTYQHSSDGETEMVINAGTIVMNLYDKITWEWSDEPILGYVYSRTTPSLGMEQAGTFIITKAKVEGGSAKIILEGCYSKGLYSATLDYDSDSKALLVDNIKLIRKATHNQDEAGDETFDLEPFDGMYFDNN